MQTAAHTNHSYIQLHTLQGNTRQATINITIKQRGKEYCLPPMQVSLQRTYSLANTKIKLKHCVSISAYCNQTSQHQIHYTNSEQIEIVLNYIIITIGYVKWEKFFSCFRWRIHQPIGKYSTLLPKAFVCQQNPNTYKVIMKRIWWRSVCAGHFQQNALNKFRYPYIQLVVSLIFHGCEQFDG